MDEETISYMVSDVPIEQVSEDLFNFTELAEKTATHILSYTKPESFVIGITVTWGAGKSSLLNLMEVAIIENCRQRNVKEPVTIKYSPWLLSNRGELLANFLLLLCSRLSDETSTNFFLFKYFEKLKKRIWDYQILKKYAKAISDNDRKPGIVNRVANIVGIPLISEFWEILKNFFATILLRSDTTNFDALRNSATSILVQQKKPIVVFIDDIDRLAKEEIIEIFRLVRSTAQLPRIIYVLAFDKQRVSNIITSSSKQIETAYIDKIVQLFVEVPQVYSSDLENLLTEKVTQLPTTKNFSSTDQENFNFRLSTTIGVIDDLNALRTPRDVYRLFNAYSFGVRLDKDPIPEPGDLLTKCMILTNFPNVNEWLIEYDRLTNNEQNTTFDESISFELVEKLKHACVLDNIKFEVLNQVIDKICPPLNGVNTNELFIRKCKRP